MSDAPFEAYTRWEPPPTLTVRELIEALQKCDPDAEVLTEGCDCEGEAKSVTTYPYAENTIQIGRWYAGSDDLSVNGTRERKGELVTR